MLTLKVPFGLPSTDETLAPETSPLISSAGLIATVFPAQRESVTTTLAETCVRKQIDNRQITAIVCL